MMEQSLFINFLALVAVAYLYFVVKLLRGWQLFVADNKPTALTKKGISVVIPFRNEAENLANLLQSLEALDYPKQNFEVILVDDASIDAGPEIVNDWLAKTEVTTRIVLAVGSGKKAAQAQAVKLARFEVIACTDADCHLPTDWLTQINNCFQNEKVALSFGPVTFGGDGHPFQKLEFLSLIASTMAMLKVGWPVMGNAANMAFTKKVFLASEEALQKVPTASGDDVFLLHHVTKSGAKIETHKAIATTQPQPDLSTLLSQRLRWAAKARHYQQTSAIVVGALVLSINALMLAGGLAFLFGATLPWTFWLMVAVKWVMDFILLWRSASFFEQKLKPHIFLLQEILNVVYVPGVAVLSQLVRFSWKGRRY
jgi:cellulose synthase/poly-beta-1,6-N-acetylglucosamine synthase-like glycosyltransferase